MPVFSGDVVVIGDDSKAIDLMLNNGVNKDYEDFFRKGVTNGNDLGGLDYDRYQTVRYLDSQKTEKQKDDEFLGALPKWSVRTGSKQLTTDQLSELNIEIAATGIRERIVEAITRDLGKLPHERLKGAHCWDWVDKIYKAAGITRKLRPYQNLNYSGNVAPARCHAGPKLLDTLEPGDWLYINNRNRFDSHGNHSVIFLGWADKSNRIANMASCPGANKMGRMHKTDLNKNPVVHITKPMTGAVRIPKSKEKMPDGTDLEVVQSGVIPAAKEDPNKVFDVHPEWKILLYAACKKEKITPGALMSMMWTESRFDTNAVNSTSKAQGLGQFLPAAYADFVKANPSFAGRSRKDPEFGFYATAWYARYNANQSGIPKNKTITELEIYDIYLAHHEGANGRKRFIRMANEFDQIKRQTGLSAEEIEAQQGEALKKKYGYGDSDRSLLKILSVRGLATNIAARTRLYDSKLDTIDEYFSSQEIATANRELDNAEAPDVNTLGSIQRNVDRLAQTKDKLKPRGMMLNPLGSIITGGAIGSRYRNDIFDSELAKLQIKYLYREGVRNIVSCARVNKVQAAVEAVKQDVGYDDLNFTSFTLNTQSGGNNVRHFQTVASLSGKTYMHCENGAHRAPLTGAMALLLKGESATIDHAFRSAGVKPSSYRNHKGWYKQGLDFAFSKGYKLEDPNLITGSGLQLKQFSQYENLIG